MSFLPNDVSRCTGTDHELCSSCLRATAPMNPGSFWTPWMSPPIEGDSCDYRIDNDVR